MNHDRRISTLRIGQLMSHSRKNQDRDEFVADLLADVRHFCDTFQLSFADLDKRGYRYYLDELHGTSSADRLSTTENTVARSEAEGGLVTDIIAAVADEGPAEVELGVFSGHDCLYVVPISVARALGLQKELQEAIDHARTGPNTTEANFRNTNAGDSPAPAAELSNVATPLRLSIPDAAWRDDTEARDRSHLLGGIVINGCHFHIDAIEVEEKDGGIMDAVDPSYQQELEHFYGMSAAEGAFETLDIQGRPYVIGITPHR